MSFDLTQLKDWWATVPDEVKRTAVRGTIGAGAGAATLGAFGRSPEDEDAGGMHPALLGALLGGGSAAAGPLAMKMLSGDIKFDNVPEEEVPPPTIVEKAEDALDTGIDKGVEKAMGNAFTTGGLALGANHVRTKINTRGNLHKFISKPNSEATAQVSKDMNTTVAKNFKPFKATSTAASGLGKKIKGGDLSGAVSKLKSLAISAGKDTSNIVTGKGAPPSLNAARRGAGLKSPAAAIGSALLYPLAGKAIDRYMYGKN